MSNCKYDILEVGFVPPPYGGVSVFIERLCKSLTQDGYIAGSFYMLDSDGKYKHSDLFYLWHWMSTKRMIREYKYYSKIVKNFKVVHSHMSLESMTFLWLFHKVLHKRIIITVHNSMIDSYYRTDKNFINKFFLKKVAAMDVRWIAVSQQSKDGLMRLPFKFRNDISVIPAYIPKTDDFGPELNPLMASYIDNHKQILTFYGHSFMMDSRQDIYGFISAIEVYAQLVKEFGHDLGLVFCIADDSDKKKIELVKENARRRKVEDLIFWQIGPINNMYRLWEKTTVYIRPTSTDGDSVAVREALDMGARVVASDVCSRPYGVRVYRYGNQEDFATVLRDTIGMKAVKTSINMKPYEQVKLIYNEELAKI